MNKVVLLLIVVTPAVSIGQTISISPTSVTAISQTPYTGEIMISYKAIDLHFIHTSKKVFKGAVHSRPETYWGVSISPEFDLKYLQAEPMAGFYNKPVASFYGSRFNFGFSIYRNLVNSIDLYVRHLSNAGMGELNPGIDWVGIRVKL